MKAIIQKILGRYGYRIVNFRKTESSPGKSHLLDIARILQHIQSPMIFDVGANRGQSAIQFNEFFRKPTIHSFEPTPSTFDVLKKKCTELANAKPWNFAVGSEKGMLKLHENTFSEMNSLLPKTKLAWGEELSQIQVEVITLDEFAAEQGIEFIHLLKSDTQGFDMEVFKGAKDLMMKDKIGLLFFEVTFVELYENLPKLGELFTLLESNRFKLIGIYDHNYIDGKLGWCDLLFVNNKFSTI